MTSNKVFEHGLLESADLVVDAVYQGGGTPNFSSAALPKLLSVGTSGGFRTKRCTDGPSDYSYVVLFTTFSEPSWPDNLNPETGIFTYYGDNREPGSTIHEKPGNKILRDIFEYTHTGRREKVPPVFVFSSTGEGYNRQFLGLAVPGYSTEQQSEDLVAIWKNDGGCRFQNYRAKFTVLDTERVTREWIEALHRGEPMVDSTPTVWRDWVRDGTYDPLKATRTREHRTKQEQEPSTETEREVLDAVYTQFEGRPTDFEDAAVGIFNLVDGNVGEVEVTRTARDGGRDAVGTYNISPDIGPDSDNLAVNFALEAKCYKPGSPNGVDDTSRLISRLRHRQFGVFVTTSHLGRQAYKELKEDGHPVLVLSGGDIAKILVSEGYDSREAVVDWLDSQPRT